MKRATRAVECIDKLSVSRDVGQKFQAKKSSSYLSRSCKDHDPLLLPTEIPRAVLRTCNRYVMRMARVL